MSFLCFESLAQKHARLNFVPFKRPVEFNSFAAEPEIAGYEIITLKKKVSARPKKNDTYFTPYRVRLHLSQPKYIPHNKFKNEVHKLSFTKKPIKNTTFRNDVPMLISKDAALNIKYTDKKDGFFSNSIIEMAQTADGMIWFTSANNGICRYNGKTTEILTTASGLPSNYTNRVFCDSQNRLWVATSNGICYIKDNFIYIPDHQINHNIWAIGETTGKEIWFGTLDNNGVYRYVNDSLYHINQNYIPGDVVEALLGDKNGNMWIGTNNYSLSKFDGKGYTNYKFYSNVNENTCLEIHENEHGLWFSYFDKHLINLQNGVFSEFRFNAADITRIFGIADNSLGMWIADLQSGIYLVDWKNNRVESFVENKTIGGKSIYMIDSDEYGNIWAGSLMYGVFRIDNQQFSSKKTVIELKSQRIKKIIPHNGKVWYLPDGGFINIEDKQKYMSFYHDIIPGFGSKFYIYDAEIINDYRAWLACYSIGPGFLDNQKFYFFKMDKGCYVIDISSADKKEIWYATESSGVMQYKDSVFFMINEQTGLSQNQTTCVIHTAPDELWAGTKNNGINIIKDKRIGYFNKEHGIADNQINNVFIDHKKRIWLSTMNGISVVENNMIANLNARHGIISNLIYSVSQDSHGNYWVATDNGLSKLEPTDELVFLITNYNMSSGQYLNGFSSMVTGFPNGQMLWKNSSNDMVMYNPEKNTQSQRKIILRINSILIDNEEVDSYCFEDEVVINPNQNLQLKFTAIDWGNEQNLQYKYALLKEKRESLNWIDLGKTNTISLFEIPHGKYELFIHAENLNTFVKRKIRLTFLPHWWQTITFKILSVIGVFLIMFGVFLSILWRNKRRQRKLEQIIQEKTKELRKENKIKDALINEIHHRVKNNLQTISSLIYMQQHSVDDEIAQKKLLETQLRIKSIAYIHEMLYADGDFENISMEKYIRQIIDTLDNMVNSEKRDIQFDLHIEKVELPINKSITIGMFTNEVITNSIKYAFEGIKNPRIMVKLLNQKDKIFYSISDNGIGFKKIKNDKKSLGMRLIDIFARQLNALKIVNAGNGVSISLIIPNAG